MLLVSHKGHCKRERGSGDGHPCQATLLKHSLGVLPQRQSGGMERGMELTSSHPIAVAMDDAQHPFQLSICRTHTCARGEVRGQCEGAQGTYCLLEVLVTPCLAWQESQPSPRARACPRFALHRRQAEPGFQFLPYLPSAFQEGDPIMCK